MTAKNKKKKVAQLRYQEGGEPSFWAATPKSKGKVGRGLRWFVDIDTCGVITSVGVSQKQTLGRTVMHKWKEMCLAKEIDPADVYLEPGHETIKPKLARAAAHLVALLPQAALPIEEATTLVREHFTTFRGGVGGVLKDRVLKAKPNGEPRPFAKKPVPKLFGLSTLKYA